MEKSGGNMDFTKALLNAGLDAVKTYTDSAGIDREDDIPEKALSAHIALHLHQILGLHARIETLYTDIVTHLGMSPKTSALKKIEGRTTDIALYQRKTPVAIIEIKIFSDAKDPVDKFEEDLRKGDPVELSRHVPIHVVAMICETQTRDMKMQKQRIEAIIRRPIAYSPCQKSRSGEPWFWCIASVAKGTEPGETN
jgi:hypothetical protein